MGYNMVTTISISKKSGFSEEQATGSLRRAAQGLAGLASADFERVDVDKTFLDNVSVKVVGDLELGSLPQTLEGMREFNRRLPERVECFNGGWGVPKKVYLAPLTCFKELKNPVRVSIADINTVTLKRIVILMVNLEELVMRCEELKILNKHTSGCWSAGAKDNLTRFEGKLQRQIDTIQSDLKPALNRLYLENDEDDVLKILSDCQLEGSPSFGLLTKGAEWLSSVREHIEHLQATAHHIQSRVDEGRVHLRWISPSSQRALTTQLLKVFSRTVVRTSRRHR